MRRNPAKTNAWGYFAVVAVLGTARLGQAQDAPAPYPRMAPIEQYLMDRDAEIALARSAAPAAISRDAGILVLGRSGFETAVKSTNGFVCVVDRSWAAPFDDPEFWNPKIRGPMCYNPPAARSILPASAKRQAMVLAGLPKTRVIENLKVAYDTKELPAPEVGSMGYMMSKGAYLTGGGGSLAHLMFFLPMTEAKEWGAGLPGSLVMVFQNTLERQTTFVVPVSQWSDGTPASMDAPPPASTTSR